MGFWLKTNRLLPLILIGAASLCGDYRIWFQDGKTGNSLGLVGFWTGILKRPHHRSNSSSSGWRDQSYHYLPASDEVEVNKESLPLFQAFLDRHMVSYQSRKVDDGCTMPRAITTKMKRRKGSKEPSVDMECSAVAALAAFRAELCHFFCMTDHLSQKKNGISEPYLVMRI